MNTTNIFKQFTKNTVGKFTRIKFTKNGSGRKQGFQVPIYRFNN